MGFAQTAALFFICRSMCYRVFACFQVFQGLFAAKETPLGSILAPLGAKADSRASFGRPF